MTMADVIRRIEAISVTETYTDKDGNCIGKSLARWVDVKTKVIKILQEYEKIPESEGKADEEVEETGLNTKALEE